MGVFTSPAALMAHQRKRFNLVGRKMEVVHQSMAEQGEGHLKRLTSGTLSKKQLRGWRPYARQPLSARRLAKGVAAGSAGLGIRDSGRRQVGRTGTVSPYPINKWSGGVHAGIFLTASGRNSYNLGSTARSARFLFNPEGTRYMVPRRIFGDRRKHGQDGMVRVFFRAEVHGYLLAVRDYQRRVV